MSGLTGRLEAFASKLPQGMDAAMITSDINRRYYTGFPSSAGILLAARDKAYLIIDSRYYEAAKTAAIGCEVILQDKAYEQVSALLKKHSAKTLGIEDESVSLSALRAYREKLPEAEILTESGISALINAQRRVKSGAELKSMLAAQRIADETFAYICEYIEPGMTEKEIALEMEFYSRKNGSEEASFSFIVASGENSAVPHAVPGERRVRGGDFIVMDYGCVVDGCHSDMTRTVAVGFASDKQRHVYDTVLKAQLAALDAIKPGLVCRDIDKIARDIIDGAGYEGLFGHGLGHGLGLEIHEPPNFAPANETVLETGFVMSVEPGIYIPGEFGVRIEDVIAVTDNGCENLMTSPKEFIIL